MRTVRVLDREYPQLAGRFSAAAITVPSPVDYSWGGISKPDGSPALRYVFDPDPKFIRAGAGVIGPDAWRDCASGSKWSSNAAKSLVTGSALNGRPSISLDAATALLASSDSGGFNKNELSFFAVFNTPVASTVRTLIGPAEVVATTPLAGSINILLNTSGALNVYWGSTGEQLIDAAHVYQGVPVLLMVTFSQAKGVSIRRNGVEVVRSASRVAPLLGAKLNIFSASGSGSRFSGVVGKMGLADVDLSRPEYADSLAAIEAHLLSYYSLAA